MQAVRAQHILTIKLKPLLAATTSGRDLTYPLYASPKLDGIRALIVGGEVLSRTLKPIPNRSVQHLFGRAGFNGLDGELIVGDPTDPDAFRRTSSGVMSINEFPSVTFHVFDCFNQSDIEFSKRLEMLNHRIENAFSESTHVVKVPQTLIRNREELELYEQTMLAQGFEGVMLRRPGGIYKHGRSTLREGILMKLKRFADSEAVVIGYEELLTNENEATVDKLGHKVRSSHQANKVPGGRLGALKVRDLKTGVEFDIGTGFDDADRRHFWTMRDTLLGRVVKYKYFPGGVKDKPRFPVFIYFRDKLDIL
jgi:DNA ligase-1